MLDSLAPSSLSPADTIKLPFTSLTDFFSHWSSLGAVVCVSEQLRALKIHIHNLYPNHTQTRNHGLQATSALSEMVELLLSRSGTLTWKLIRNPSMTTNEQSNSQCVNTVLRFDHTTPAPTLFGCGRACKLLYTTMGSTAASCPVTRAYQTS